MKLLSFMIALLLVTHNALAAPLAAFNSKTALCFGCHGSTGISDNSFHPILAGQKKSYLIKQLTDFKTARRQEEHMSSMVKALNAADINDIAAYFSGQSRKQAQANRLSNAAGKQLYFKIISAETNLSCSSCHGIDGSGDAMTAAPIIAAQHANYLIKTLKDFRSHQRHNDPDDAMRMMTEHLTDSEIEILADFISTMR